MDRIFEVVKTSLMATFLFPFWIFAWISTTVWIN